MFSPDDTIVAIATPPGRGGIGVIRISGAEAHRVATALLAGQRPLEERRATFTRLAGVVSGGVGDEVVVTFFPSPHSYTGEDVVEISAHGSPVVLRLIVERAIAHGARLARTRRVHAARLPERQARSGAVRSRCRSHRSRHSASGANGIRSARRIADAAHQPHRCVAV